MSLDPRSLSIADVARLLTSTSGRAVTEEMVRITVAAGLPLKADDRIDILVLTAWLNRETAHAQD